jgi:transposase
MMHTSLTPLSGGAAMSLAELVITSVLVEGRSKSEVARDYRISRYWVHQLVTRFQVEGEAAYQPRSRRPHRSPHAVGAGVEERIIRLRKELSKQGLDAGAQTIRVHLQRHPDGARAPAVSTIWRVLSRRGFITPQPRKRPRSAGKPANSSASSPSTPTATTSPSADHQPHQRRPENATMSRHTRQRCPETSHGRARRDSNPQPSDP